MQLLELISSVRGPSLCLRATVCLISKGRCLTSLLVVPCSGVTHNSKDRSFATSSPRRASVSKQDPLLWESLILKCYLSSPGPASKLTCVPFTVDVKALPITTNTWDSRFALAISLLRFLCPGAAHHPGRPVQTSNHQQQQVVSFLGTTTAILSSFCGNSVVTTP